MKKLIMMLLIALGVMVLCNTVSAKNNEVSARVLETYNNGIKKKVLIKTGKRTQLLLGFYKSGNLWYERPYVDGKENGVNKHYCEEGHLRVEEPIENGKRHGMFKVYYEDGSLWYETPYENGKEHGVERKNVRYAGGGGDTEITYFIHGQEVSKKDWETYAEQHENFSYHDGLKVKQDSIINSYVKDRVRK